jgi:hypothetical protein
MAHGNRTTYRAEYRVWVEMRKRCRNPKRSNYHLYGARGIRVCDRWERFDNFLADMGPRPSSRHSLDRIDPDGHYEPGNVRWATATQQARNKRTNRRITYDGRTQLLTDWANELGIRKSVLHWRLAQGWSLERALSKKSRTHTAWTRLVARFTRAWAKRQTAAA